MKIGLEISGNIKTPHLIMITIEKSLILPSATQIKQLEPFDKTLLARINTPEIILYQDNYKRIAATIHFCQRVTMKMRKWTCLLPWQSVK